jgi:hypothetical protein
MGERERPTSEEEMSQLMMWKRSAEDEIAELESRIDPLRTQLDAARERLDLVRRLIHLHDPPVVDTPPMTNVGPSSPTSPRAVGGSNLEEDVETLLAGAGEPMHIRDIREALVQQGVPLPGRGDEANIIVRLRRSPDRFTRTGRGRYALASWGLPEMQPSSRKKVVKRSKRKRS